MAKVYDLFRRDGRGLCAVLLDGDTAHSCEMALARLLDWTCPELRGKAMRGFAFDHRNCEITAMSQDAEKAGELAREFINRFKRIPRRKTEISKERPAEPSFRPR